MTKRAIFIGLAIASLVGAIGFFNDMVMKQTKLSSSYMPIFIYGSLFLFVISLNPMMRMLNKNVAFSAKELALIIAIILPSCYVGGRGMIHHFTMVLMTPHSINKVTPGWQKRRVLRRVPSVMLAGVEPGYVPEDILKPGELAAQLEAVKNSDMATPVRKLAVSLPTIPTDRAGLAAALNASLGKRELFTSEDFARAVLPVWVKQLEPDGPMNQREVIRLNRYRVDELCGDSVVRLEAKEAIAIDGFQRGLSEGGKRIGIDEVPWHAWTRTLSRFWFPLLFSIGFAYIGLALVVKRRWTQHEHIPFPIVTFAQSLLPGRDNSLSSILRMRAFWIATGIVLVIHLNNFGFQWFPERMVDFPVHFDFGALADLFPTFKQGGGKGLLRPTFYFCVIGFAYFVASDVSLSIGIAPFIYAVVAGFLLHYGISINSGGGYNSLRIDNFIKSGSYFGMFLIILYTGRSFYLSVLKSFFARKPMAEVKDYEIWGARLAAASCILFAVQLCSIGIAWYWAICHTLIVCMSFVVVSRMLGETGMFLLHPMILPIVIFWGFLGPRAIGAEQMLLLMVISGAMDIGCQVGVMPMMVHSLKLADRKPGRTAVLAGAGLVLAIVVGVFASLYFQYDVGTSTTKDGWTNYLSHAPYRSIVKIEDRLDAQGALDSEPSLKHISMGKPQVIAFVLAFALVLLTEFGRLRISKFPIHPVLFLVSGFWHARVLAASFLISWVLKIVVTKYGGSGSYKRLKPVMIGLIAGDMLAGILIVIFCIIYYFATGEQPKSYSVIPA